MRRGAARADARSQQEEEHSMSNPLAREKEPHAAQEEQAPPAHAEGKPLTIEQIFAEVDTDHSGTIEFREFAEYWGAKQVQTRGTADEDALGTIWELFEKYDADGNSGLCLLEFRELISEMAMGDWKEERDPRTGRTYFVNPITRASQWVRPGVSDFLEQQGIVQTEKPLPTVDVGGARKEHTAADDADAEPEAEVHMMLNLWKIYIKKERQNRKRHYNDALTYLVYTLLLMSTMVLCTPLSASLLAHQEALADLLLDEEFAVVDNHKKSWYDVMTLPELWQWVEGPLHDAFYQDAVSTEPAALLWSNELLGRIQVRQARVEPTKCLYRPWAPFTYGPDPTPLPGRACAGTFPSVERKHGGEAKFETEAAAHEKFQERRATWQDPDNAGWDAAADGGNEQTDAWAGAAKWYGDWGTCWLDDAEDTTELKGSPVFVESFLGEPGRPNRFGHNGYAVTLPRNRWDWEEQVRQLKGEFVCVDGGVQTGERVKGAYIADLDDAEREMRAEGCWAAGDCSASETACRALGAQEWRQSKPFIDKYTRMLVVTFNLYNGNDFDWDEEEMFYEEQDQNTAENLEHLDDHLVFGQVSFTFGPSGHIEKYQRITIVRPMRAFAYLDSSYKSSLAYLFALMAVALFLTEARTAYRMGLTSYFITSENSVWNLYEIIFFVMFLFLVNSINSYLEICRDVDSALIQLSTDGQLDETFYDLHSMKSKFRTMTRNVSVLVFLSILKSFKFMSLSDNLNFMYKILLRAKSEIFGFMTVYAILMACFAFFTQQLFGYEIRNFHNFQSALISLIRLSVGILDFDYVAMKEADSAFSPLFLLVFVFVCMLTAINMFIAILSEYYTIVKTESTQLKEDIKIFESQGMTVPSSSVFDGFSSLWSNFWLKFTLMVETDPPHVPVQVQPVRRIVGPTWGQGAQQIEEAGGLTCHANIHENASNLVRIHLYSEFVPTELENHRGKARANIPILGEVLEGRFRSHCVGLGDTRSPINELIAQYGKLWSEDVWVCGNPRCKHIYDAARDGGGMTMEELYAREKDKWSCPKCKKTSPEKPWAHIGHKFTYHRQDTGVRTVCCLKLHPDDMHSEVRPQVLLKMRPRFTTITNPADGSQDPDYANQCENPDTVDLLEDTFGAQIRLELLIHEEMKEDIVYGEKEIGKARDIFALFRVSEISSWEHFSGEPTKLNKAPGMWRSRDDKKLYEMMGLHRPSQGTKEGGQLTNSQMAEMFNKTERQVDLRRRFLKRLHTNADGWPVTPKVLRVSFQPSWRTTMRMWRQSRQDDAMKVVSMSYLCSLFRSSFHCKRYSDPHERDMKRFIRMLTQHIIDNNVENRKDITELETKFLMENMSLDEAIGKMKVQLVNSGQRAMVGRTCRCCGYGGSRSMIELYGEVDQMKMVTVKNELTGEEEQLSVEDKLRRWMMSKFAYEIDAVIVRNEDDDDDDEDEDMGLVVTPGGHRERASSASARLRRQQEQEEREEQSRIEKLKARRVQAAATTAATTTTADKARPNGKSKSNSNSNGHGHAGGGGGEQRSHQRI
jgi:hypothetical protein